MKMHELKTDSAQFQAIVDGSKTFELRYDDRGFAQGDILRLVENGPSSVFATTYFPRARRRVADVYVSYILYAPGREQDVALDHDRQALGRGWVVMGIKLLQTEVMS